MPATLPLADVTTSDPIKRPCISLATRRMGVRVVTVTTGDVIRSATIHLPRTLASLGPSKR